MDEVAIKLKKAIVSQTTAECFDGMVSLKKNYCDCEYNKEDSHP